VPAAAGADGAAADGGGVVRAAPADNPAPSLLPIIDAGTYADRMDVPFQCAPNVFCKRTERGQENCGTLTLTLDVASKPSPIDLLLVFDQSRSMADAWANTGQSKLDAARAAIADTVAGLEDDLNVGAIFFPTYACGPWIRPRPGGAVAPIDGPGQIPMQPAKQFLDAWNQHWSRGAAALGDGTPLQEAFDRADQAIQTAGARAPLVVVAVTDGEPNCTPDPALTQQPTAAETDRAHGWSMNGVQTYVVGLPGASGAQLLRDIASSGGTDTYVLPDQPKLLEDDLRHIVGTAIDVRTQACEIELKPPAFEPVSQLEVDMVRTGGQRDDHVPHGAGWTVSSDGRHVSFSGDLCDDILAGAFAAITFEYGCDHSTSPPSPGLQ
jgi:hypothetical protein